MFEKKFCELCGKLATCMTRDIKQRQNWKTGLWEKEPYGPPHYFCKEHDRSSETIDLTVSPFVFTEEG